MTTDGLSIAEDDARDGAEGGRRRGRLDPQVSAMPLRASLSQGSAISADVQGCRASLATLETLARLALESRRCGLQLNLRGESRELRGLIELTGLAGVFGLRPQAPDGHAGS